MYNSLSNIQKHLYSLIQQNNPEYLQQSINEEYRSKRRNLANLTASDAKPAENPSDFEGMDQQAAEQLRARREAGEDIIKNNAAAKLKDPGKEERKKEANRLYYQDLVRELPADPTKWTDVQAANVAMLKTMTKVTPELKGDPALGDLSGIKKTNLSSDKLAELSVKTNQNNPSPSSQSRMALRYQKKAEENARPYGDRPISPFYRMTRNEFKSTLGRDFDESGGANPDNMRALLNHQTNLGQRLHDIERDWHDDQSERIMTDLMPKNPNLGNMMSWYVASHKAVRKNDRDNPTYIHPETSLDVPPPLSPRERARIPLDAAGKPIDPNDPRGRRLPTSPIDTKRKTRDPFTGEEEWKMFDINLDQPKPTKNGICPGPFCQTSNLTGKSVNSKVSRIA